MTEPDDLAGRVESLEEQVVHLREQTTQAVTDAAAARVLAAGADHDVSEVRAELRAHTRAISALHDDHVELRSEYVEFRAEMYGFRAEMHEFRADMYAFRDETRIGFAKTERAFATVNAGMARIVELLEP